jgi:hypothetical protein
MTGTVRKLALVIGLWACSASADTGLRILTPGGAVAFTVGDDWVVLSRSTPREATFDSQPSNDGTPDSTNLVLSPMTPVSEVASHLMPRFRLCPEAPTPTVSGP